ncbi:ABC transporter permease [Atopobacter sp. AH10]|uniref:ABC transporter permease n=1 Tax=Atopobacter sp. AH10 TaxID=2315861 RepID=UPI000EF2889D|nr:ABC transporter permease [Atopobacter sp. AH10]RLK62728.1 ABC transporter permease [Atopobacter sp. AH10]
MIKNIYNSSVGLIKWSLIRHKVYIPAFVIVQMLLSVSVIYGFSFITNAVDKISRTFLCTGAITINIIAITCVLSPQIVSEAKQNGVLDYQKTLPIARVGIIMADLFIWGVISLPGIFASMIVGSLYFNMNPQINMVSCVSLIFIMMALTFFGFSIAYLFPANIVPLITQVIMMGSLMFSPIVYSADRLPMCMAYIYNYLPFVPVSKIIRFCLFGLDDFKIMNYIVILFWGSISFLSSLYVLTRRG